MVAYIPFTMYSIITLNVYIEIFNKPYFKRNHHNCLTIQSIVSNIFPIMTKVVRLFQTVASLSRDIHTVYTRICSRNDALAAFEQIGKPASNHDALKVFIILSL